MRCSIKRETVIPSFNREGIGSMERSHPIDFVGYIRDMKLIRANRIKEKKGQALIETALVLILLLIILVGIAEFSRAWYRKSSLKNGVRQGARVAAVTPAANFTVANTSFTCNASTTCPNGDSIINAVCCQPGLPRGTGDSTAVTVTCTDTNNVAIACTAITSGGTVKVSATYTNASFFIVGGGIWPWGKGISITTDASMRYE